MMMKNVASKSNLVLVPKVQKLVKYYIGCKRIHTHSDLSFLLKVRDFELEIRETMR